MDDSSSAMGRAVIVRKSLLGALALLVLLSSGYSFRRHRHFEEPVIAGPGVTRVLPLSTWFDGIRGINDMLEGTKLPRLNETKIEEMIHRDSLELLGLDEPRRRGGRGDRRD